MAGQRPSLVGADQFVYYRQHDPIRRLAPDLYVLPGVPPDTRIRSWKTWRDGPAPAFVLEVVTSDWRKDYADSPRICGEAGVREMMVFDPSFSARPRGEGARFQVYRRSPSGDCGDWALAERHDRDRAWSETLGVWFRIAGFGDRTRLRVALGPGGDELLATPEEALEAERAEKEAERAEKEAVLERVKDLEARLRAWEDTD